MNNADGAIETTDLGEATFLFSIGAQLESIDRGTPRRAVFTFALGPAQKDGISKWKDGSAMVNALAFWTSYQRLKIELYNTGDRARDGAERCRPTA